MNSLVSLISQLRDVAWRETTTLLVPHPAVRAWVCMASAVTTVLVLVVRVRRILTSGRAPGKSIQAGATTAWTVRVTRRPCELVGSGVAWDVFPGQALQSVVETRLVGLHGQDAVLVCDLFGGVTPGVEGVHRHHGPFQVHQGQKAPGSGDLVLLARNLTLAQCQAVVVTVGCYQVRGSRAGVAGPADGLTVQHDGESAAVDLRTAS